jgi:hypothetical protein
LFRKQRQTAPFAPFAQEYAQRTAGAGNGPWNALFGRAFGSVGHPDIPNKSLTSGKLTSSASVAFRRRLLPLDRVYIAAINWIVTAVASQLKRFEINEAEELERLR